MNHELSFVDTWFKANKLTLHPDKTKFILFHPARKKINLYGLSIISIDKNSINRVEHTKFLGVIIHQNLSWQAHIKVISSKIAKSTGIIIKSWQFSFLQKLLPSPLSSLFVFNSDCHQYLTRQKDNLYLHIHTNIPFLFGYRVLKFGMTFLSHFVIHLLFLVININWEIIFNHYKFKLSGTQFLFSTFKLFSLLLFAHCR